MQRYDYDEDYEEYTDCDVGVCNCCNRTSSRSDESPTSKPVSSGVWGLFKSPEEKSREMATRVLRNVTDPADIPVEAPESDPSPSAEIDVVRGSRPEPKSTLRSDYRSDGFEDEGESEESCDECDYGLGYTKHSTSLAVASGGVIGESLDVKRSVARTSSGSLTYFDPDRLEVDLIKSIDRTKRAERVFDVVVRRAPFVYVSLAFAFVVMAAVFGGYSPEAFGVINGLSLLNVMTAFMILKLRDIGWEMIDRQKARHFKSLSGYAERDGSFMTSDEFIDYVDETILSEDRCVNGRIHLSFGRELVYRDLSDQFIEATNASLADPVVGAKMSALLHRLVAMAKDPGSPEKMRLGRMEVMKEMYRINETVAMKSAVIEGAKISAIDDYHDSLNRAVIDAPESS